MLHIRRQAAFGAITDQLSGAVPSPLAGPSAPWMPPRSLQGRIHGVSRKWRGHRAFDSSINKARVTNTSPLPT
ncbi:hypothetical protein XaCFBP7622_00115 [Xanthomonas arboricola]|nr:hypothetical protein XaCFBP7622_00115 [Xanthomonas arboricola]